MGNKIKIIDNVDLKEALGERFVENEKSLDCNDDFFCEFVSVDKTTREITSHGFTGFLQALAHDGLIEYIL